MRIERRYTKDGQSPYAGIDFRLTTSEIKNPDGSVVFRLDNVEVPDFWSQVAADVLAQKYFRKAGVPPAEEGRREQRPLLAVALGRRRGGARDLPENERYGGEHSPSRSSTASPAAGPTGAGRAATSTPKTTPRRSSTSCATCSPRRWRAELAAVVQHRPALGLRHRRPGQGHYYVDPETGKLTKSTSAYEHPQPHACFIQSINDDLVNEGGIMDLWVREARLFKYGSGTGSNFSRAARRRRTAVRRRQVVRPDELPQDRRPRRRRHQVGRHHAPRRQDGRPRPRSSGHRGVHQLEGDRGAEGRRAGHRLEDQPKHLNAILKACVNCEGAGDDCFDAGEEPGAEARDQARAASATVPDNYIERVIQFAKQGFTDIEFAIYDTDWDSEAYLTVSGQNTNNSVRVTNEFLQGRRSRRRLGPDLAQRTGKVAQDAEGPRPVGPDRLRRLGLRRSRRAVRHHHQRVAHLPGVAAVNASNPCSEYMFLDDTACNLASLNLLQFCDTQTRHVRRRRATSTPAALDDGPRNLGADGAVPVEARSPQLSYDFRTLGLGYANIGGLLMIVRHPLRLGRRPRHLRRAHRDHDRRRPMRPRPRWRPKLGPFPGYEKNRDAHAARHPQPSPRRLRRAPTGYERSAIAAGAARRSADCPRSSSCSASTPRAKRAWDQALALGEKHGYRNAQVTVIAPTGTIGLVMDCDTTGIEPDFALVKFKKLAGGGYFKIINRAVPEALRTLGYSRSRHRRDRGLRRRPRHARRRRPHINHATLKAKGFTDEASPRSRRRCRPPSTSSSSSTAGPSARTSAATRSASPRGQLDAPDLRPARRARLHQARDRGRQHPCLRRHDPRRRAAPEGRALRRSSTAPTRAAAPASATSRSRATSA